MLEEKGLGYEMIAEFTYVLLMSRDNPLAEKETVTFDEDVSGKTVTVYCIDKNTTNPYRLYERLGMGDMDKEMLSKLREEGNLKPVIVQKGEEPLTLRLTANSTYLIMITE